MYAVEKITSRTGCGSSCNTIGAGSCTAAEYWAMPPQVSKAIISGRRWTQLKVPHSHTVASSTATVRFKDTDPLRGEMGVAAHKPPIATHHCEMKLNSGGGYPGLPFICTKSHFALRPLVSVFMKDSGAMRVVSIPHPNPTVH